MVEDIKQTMEQEPETALEIPDRITPEFLDQALACGKVQREGRVFFIKPWGESAKLNMYDEYGFPEPGKNGTTYFFHGTKSSDLPSITKMGLISVPESVNIATTVETQVGAGSKRKSGEKGVVCVWQAPWADVEIEGTGFPEAIGWPKQKFEGDKSQLPIKFRNKEDLRVMSPDKMIGFFVVEN